MENLLDSIKMSQLTDSSVEHNFGEIAQMDNSEALTVERFAYLYPTARLGSLERILSDQMFIYAHNHHVHYDGYKEVPAELRRFKGELYNLKFTLLPEADNFWNPWHFNWLSVRTESIKQASANASLIYIANRLRSRPTRSFPSIQKREVGTVLDIQGSSVKFGQKAEDFAVHQTLETYFAAASVERDNNAENVRNKVPSNDHPNLSYAENST